MSAYPPAAIAAPASATFVPARLGLRGAVHPNDVQ
jgi:hypothetical protein